jgi:hypothetical protein
VRPVEIAPAQAIELARLVEQHQPDMVVMPLQRHLGRELVVTFLSADANWRFVIDVAGLSWPAIRQAAA